MDEPKAQIVIVVPDGQPMPVYRVACSVPAQVHFARPDGTIVKVIAHTDAADLVAMAAVGMGDR